MSAYIIYNAPGAPGCRDVRRGTPVTVEIRSVDLLFSLEGAIV